MSQFRPLGGVLARSFHSTAIARNLVPPPRANAAPSQLTDRQYTQLADQELDRFLDALEQLGDEHPGLPPGYDVSLSSGVLTLHLGTGRTYVINKQPPNMQLWLSSPISGPRRFDYHSELRDWVDARPGNPTARLFPLVAGEIKTLVPGADIAAYDDQ